MNLPTTLKRCHANTSTLIKPACLLRSRLLLLVILQLISSVLKMPNKMQIKFTFLKLEGKPTNKGAGRTGAH